MNKKLLIFDLDGTLVDSLSDVALCFNEVLVSFGFPAVPYRDYLNVVGGDLEQVVFRLLPENTRTSENIDKVKNRYKEVYEKCPKGNTIPYAGIAAQLKILKTEHLLAVHSNKNDRLTKQVVEKNFGNIFDYILGSGNGSESKPSGDGVLKIAGNLGAEKDKSIYIGDTATDVLTAKNAGIACVYAKWGQGKEGDLKLYRRITVCDSPVYLQEIIKSIEEKRK